MYFNFYTVTISKKIFRILLHKIALYNIIYFIHFKKVIISNHFPLKCKLLCKNVGKWVQTVVGVE